MAEKQLFADDYKVTLDVFEGPLDLLLYLIRREELDIYDIPIEHLTVEYMLQWYAFESVFEVFHFQLLVDFINADMISPVSPPDTLQFHPHY